LVSGSSQSDFHYLLGGIATAWRLSFLTRGISVDLVVVFGKLY
jgi:hypothetical protein